MTIDDFVTMWKTDNAIEDMILVKTSKHKDKTEDLLFHVFYRHIRGGNGRHEALRVRVSAEKQVVSHDIFNLHGNEWGREDAQLDPNNNYLQQIDSWFTSWSKTYTTVTIANFGSSTATTTFFRGSSSTTYT